MFGPERVLVLWPDVLLVAFVPVQRVSCGSLEAVQEDAFVVVQVRLVFSLSAMVIGPFEPFALISTVGAGGGVGAVTVTELVQFSETFVPPLSVTDTEPILVPTAEYDFVTEEVVPLKLSVPDQE